MADDKKIKKIDNLNIGKNTRWDTPEIKPNAGATIPRPSTFLNPDKKPKK
ncbi:hypothetical protein [Gelidibacter gilvus]|nr:hypothetical protein [Gelidibacter gilvus]